MSEQKIITRIRENFAAGIVVLVSGGLVALVSGMAIENWTLFEAVKAHHTNEQGQVIIGSRLSEIEEHLGRGAELEQAVQQMLADYLYTKTGEALSYDASVPLSCIVNREHHDYRSYLFENGVKLLVRNLGDAEKREITVEVRGTFVSLDEHLLLKISADASRTLGLSSTKKTRVEVKILKGD